MRFFFADSQDFVDPGYDFENDEFSSGRQPQRDDVYAHEYFDTPPYDGILVSRSIVGDDHTSGKYTLSQSMRFRREGARSFLRYPETLGDMMGDCGAFSYMNEETPPYTVPEIADYYEECGFSHGVSIDHVIRGYSEQQHLPGTVPEDWQYRFDITLRLAEEFIEYCRDASLGFQPIGVAQGWSPESYAQAAQRLTEMGYDYIALGGMASLRTQQIHRALSCVRDAVPDVRLHLFGFTKADNIEEFAQYNLASFDSTSPVIRAFKDDRANMMLGDTWLTAIRVPYVDTNTRFRKQILAGQKERKRLQRLEEGALRSLRDYGDGRTDIEQVLCDVVAYDREFSGRDRSVEYRRTLEARPWEQCRCRACQEIGIDIVVFRGANRNRRRGFHNLQEFHRRLRGIRDERNCCGLEEA